MSLAILLLVPLCGGLIAWLSGLASPRLPRWATLLAFAADLAIAVGLWIAPPGGDSAPGAWLASFQAPWAPLPGVSFHLGADGPSLILVTLAAFLGCAASLASWAGITERAGFFHLCLAWTVAGVLGVFLALDLFLFYFAWEFMLVPMYLLIALWGHEDRFRASIKFMIFTQLSGLFMLVSILGLYLYHGRVSGAYSFDYGVLSGASVPLSLALLLQAGFLAAFLVKLPAVPLHTWLPDAHTQAPTAGSVVLAGLLLKTGAYGLFRWAMPSFPRRADRRSRALRPRRRGHHLRAFLAFAQKDVKRLVAYTSISHMGFVLLGLVSGGALAFKGAIIEIVSHGLSTGALFIVAGVLQERLHTRDLSRMGGLWAVTPRLGGASMCFALAALGLPGMGNFVGEFLIVLGVFRASPGLAVVAALGFVFSTAYSLRLMERVFFGENSAGWKVAALSAREMVLLAIMLIPLFWIGLAPQTLLDRAGRGNAAAGQEADKERAARTQAPVVPEEVRP
jgi:NADH-quinone oxidoreductase subunit M